MRKTKVPKGQEQRATATCVSHADGENETTAGKKAENKFLNLAEPPQPKVQI